MSAPPPKPIDGAGLQAVGERARAAGRKVVLCHGCFDVLHPGHVGYLQAAAAQGDVLVVSITSDDAIEKADGTRPHLPEEMRSEHLAALACVDHVVVCAAETASPVIERLKPDLYVKGSEYANSDDPRVAAERERVESLGGRVLFTSGAVVMSSTALLAAAGPAGAAGEAERLAAACGRWGLDAARALGLLRGFAGLRVVVVGDALEDRYSVSDAVEAADEGPCLSMRPERVLSFAGGAAAVASHAAALGAEVTLVAPGGPDAASRAFADRLGAAGVIPRLLPLRGGIPVKERFVVGTQKLLKVDHGSSVPLDSAGQRRLREAAVEAAAGRTDAVILSDFGLGCLDAASLAPLLAPLRPRARVLAGDVSGPRPTLEAMRGVDLLTPNERELRAACAAPDLSLPTVASGLMERLGVPNLLATLDARGAVLFHPRDPAPGRWFDHRLRSDHVPSLTARAVDPVGAGDALLAVATLTLAAGGTGPQAAYLGSVAAAVAVDRLGNAAVDAATLRSALRERPELRASTATPRVVLGAAAWPQRRPHAALGSPGVPLARAEPSPTA
ncbi:PfkB family carbohydrate kinase [Phycisphaera mikurensis]|uniref:Putative sugar kinase/nucleotidyltransferase n=1 Tax=Phycisphaera mikurensis (strain NBRC 102666 / KCTC 22515 / FYK2301M01) TaxID=1142394 RepID=I0IHF2_PHYMF|nr:PfkB family carbohydrate kinase [Phycisphaera mikurensis]MBB6440938.1 rfaE bifunctional protein kinase chain/domain/rfaE bifunctional protein nucleotidyltransferase chain/domain [Phycisphaera mikurensis]BAM04690.1 putative sugar kinase/nucleotidyltransferase [Phycisphaera mikurensis NBRC 102666]